MHRCVTILLFTFLAFWGGHSASNNINDSFLAVTYFVASAIFGFFSIIYLFQNGVKQNTLGRPIITLLIFLGWLVYGYRYGLDGEQSLSMAVKYLSGMILAISFSIYSKEPKLFSTALWTLLVVGGIYGCLTFLLLHENELWNPLVDNGVATLFSNLNILGSFFLVPLAIWPFLAHREQKPLLKNTALLFGFLSLFGLYLSNSRGAQITGLGILGISFLYFQKKRGAGLIKLALIFLATVAISNIVPASSMKYLKLGQYSLAPPDEFNNGRFIKDTMGASLGHRFKYWKKSLEFIQEKPWSGSGPYSFIVLYKPYRTEFSHNAHNLFIQTTVDSGIIGLVLLVACLFTVAFKLLKKLTRGDPANKTHFIILGLILFGTQTHYLIEYFWHIPFFLTIFIFIVSMMKTGESEKDFKRGIRGLHAPLFFILAVFGGYLANNLYQYQNILHQNAIYEDSNPETITLLESAKSYCPRCQQPFLELSKYYLNQYRKFPEKPQWIKNSTEELLKAKNFNYSDEHYYLAWGDLLTEQGLETEAKGAYLKALKVNPKNHLILEKINGQKISHSDKKPIERF
ncbi:MAG: O-antigen ligase family protein [Candidatus Nitronauta litoralis]|uniref:O-antigen ligase family protein n=1 Tax=Candidatus Nitronauta litoralis TaxID=2705533 RepID=A0A7T0BY13_9BACT|nr:MAG: O-antigen ligase family protein [Candidatus Nitronauta litoralis]